jgi:hypothetical protein
MSRLPILDKSHPINRKCVFAWDGRLAQQNLVDGRLGTQTNNVSLGVAPGSILGRKFTSGGGYQSSQINFGLYVPTNFLHGSPATWLFYTNIVTAGNIALACQTDSDASRGWQVGTSNGRLYLGLVRSSSDIRKTISNNALTGIHRIAITYDGTETNTGIHIYVDGVEQTYYASSGPSGSTSANTTDPLLLGTQRWETNQSYGGVIFNARFYQRVLSTAEIQAFSQDPYVGYVRSKSTPIFGQFIFSGSGVEVATGSAVEAGTGSQTQTGSGVEVATGSAIESGESEQHGSGVEVATGSALEDGLGDQTQTGDGVEVATGSALEDGLGDQTQTGDGVEVATGSALEDGLGGQTQTGSGLEISTGPALEDGLGSQTQTGNGIEIATGSATESGESSQHGSGVEVATGSAIEAGVGYAPPLPTFRAHQLNSNSVRLLFDSQLSDSILDPSYYTITSLAPIGTAVVPPIESVTFYDTTLYSVVINFSSSLTSGTSYHINIDGAFSLEGTYIFAFNNFDANTIDPPRATGAFLSKRGAVDILFNKPVGPYSALATFSIRNAAGGPGVSMSQLPWAGEDIPETTLRVELPPGMPTANSFVIDFINVVDESLNASSETVPLTLVLRTPPPYTYSDLTQFQILDAFVTDVSSDVFRTANVRVFFSCPVADSLYDQSNWYLYISAGHQQIDTVNYLTEGPAFDLPSLILLVNDVKLQMNGHFSIDQVHFASAVDDIIISPDAFDLDTSVTLINEIGMKLSSHMMRNKVHSYLYDAFSFTPIDIDLLAAIDASYVIADSYYSHAMNDEYQLSFSTAYQSPVNPIIAYAQELIPDAAFDVSGPYTYFADLKVNLDSDFPPITIYASLMSEDTGSFINPWDYGYIVARSASAPAIVTSHSISIDEWVEISTDRDVSVVTESPLTVTNPRGEKLPVSFSVHSSLPTLFWAFNNALESFRCHMIPAAAGHQINDTVNVITLNDYVMLPLSGAIASVNEVRLKIINHVSSAIFHYHSDPMNITAPSATDLDSLTILILDIISVLSSHLVKTGPHLYPGYRMISAPIRDKIRISVQGMINGETHTVSGFFQDEYVYNGLPKTPAPSNAISKHHLNETSFSFIGLAIRPSISSVLPMSGLITSIDESPQFGSDHLEVYFSKPMREIPVNSFNLPITGGLTQKESMWISPFVVSVAVTKMTTASYGISAIGLTDEAGNLVYP